MTEIRVGVLRVFTDESGRFGNQLGIVAGADVPPEERQRVAAELGFSETVFVDDPAAGRIRIFTPATELPFAGHPTVGAAWWLARQGYDVDQILVPAGAVQVTRGGDITWVRAAADWAPDFVWHDLADPTEVDAQDPTGYADGQHYVWAWIDEAAGAVRARTFAPGHGVAEDEATGGAAIRFTVRMRRDLEITQGLGSRLSTRYLGDGRATVGGRVVEDGEQTLGA